MDKAASEDGGDDESSDGSNGGETNNWAKASGPAEAGSAVDKEVRSTSLQNTERIDIRTILHTLRNVW